MKRFDLLAIAVAAVLFASCEKQGSREYVASQSTVAVDAVISDAGTASTKAVFSGTEFKNNETIGLYLCQSGTFLPQNSKDLNIRGTRVVPATGDPSWKFNYSGQSIYSDVLYITENYDKSKIDIYAYAPWISGMNNPKSLSVTTSSQYDLLYAEQNASATVNKGFDPAVDGQKVQLNFHHAMALLRIGVRNRYAGSTLSLQTVTISKAAGASTPLYTSAVFDAIEGEFASTTDDGKSIAITYNTNITSSADYQYFNLLLVPTQYLQDGDYVLSFKFNDVTLPQSYSIKLSDLQHDSATEDGNEGLQAGYRYTLNFSVENYLHLDGVVIDDEWSEDTIDVTI